MVTKVSLLTGIQTKKPRRRFSKLFLLLPLGFLLSFATPVNRIATEPVKPIEGIAIGHALSGKFSGANNIAIGANAVMGGHYSRKVSKISCGEGKWEVYNKFGGNEWYTCE